MKDNYTNNNISAKNKEKILHERAIKLAGKKETGVHTDGLEVVEFLIDNIDIETGKSASEHYAIEADYISEIMSVDNITYIPCTPDFVLGVVNSRGNIQSVIDIRRFLGLQTKHFNYSDAENSSNKIMNIKHDDMEFGILIDGIRGVKKIVKSEMQKADIDLLGINSNYIKGITKNAIIILDIEKVIKDKKILVDEDVR